VLAAVIRLGPDPHPANFIYMATVVLASWVAGLVVRMTEERSRLIGERRALQERARIAGELHDVVSHNVSAMVIQAAAERRDLADDSTAADTLADIERHGRQTLTELRRLLGVLRVDDDAPLTPQPGIGDLDQLVTASSRRDVQVELRVAGEPRPLGAGASLAVYRVVQESITNARKHSHARTVAVALSWQPGLLDVEVVDPGPTRRTHSLPGSGVGLRSMADRIDALGGTLEARREGEGFAVRARLPLGDDEVDLA
jgi:signal transduction histidine kinase